MCSSLLCVWLRATGDNVKQQKQLTSELCSFHTTTQVQTSHLSYYSNSFPSVAPRAHHSPAPPLGFGSCLFLIQTLMATLVSLLFPEQARLAPT